MPWHGMRQRSRLSRWSRADLPETCRQLFCNCLGLSGSLRIASLELEVLVPQSASRGRNKGQACRLVTDFFCTIKGDPRTMTLYQSAIQDEGF
jgi:hypothetical protein